METGGRGLYLIRVYARSYHIIWYRHRCRRRHRGGGGGGGGGDDGGGVVAPAAKRRRPPITTAVYRYTRLLFLYTYKLARIML